MGIVMKTKKVLMITSSFDKTCDYIINKYPEISFFRFDIDQFSLYKITYTQDGFEIHHDNKSITSPSCHSIYFRKPTMENLNGTFDAKYHQYIHKEVYSVIEGIAESFEGKVLTRPSIMRKANNKVVQASLVKKSGFLVPEMAITNCVKALNAFAHQGGIIKPVSAGEITHGSTKEFVQTNKIDPSLNSELFKYSPVYLQHYIDKDFEVRVTIINKVLFPVRINSMNNVDWRKPNNQVSYEKCTIPLGIEEKCISYMKLCDMNFGCFDFLVKDKQWYFLEMNANGQWGWLEKETGLPISKAIVDYLTESYI